MFMVCNHCENFLLENQNSLVYSCLPDFDFTAGRGIGALNKELIRMNVPLFLLKASKEIVVILKESTNADIPTLEEPDDLETVLEQSK